MAVGLVGKLADKSGCELVAYWADMWVGGMVALWVDEMAERMVEKKAVRLDTHLAAH